MFGFGRIECPLDDEMRSWVEFCMNFLAVKVGPERLSRPVVEPTREFFPFDLDGTNDTALRMFHHICGLMDVDPARTCLEFENADKPFTEGNLEYRWSADDPAGTWRRDDQGRHVIMIRDDLLDDSAAFVATAAHELAHAVMHETEMLVGHEEDFANSEEELTDMLTVLYGLGIFTANSSLRESQSDAGIGMSEWGYSRSGYLDFPLWGHVHAVYAFLRDETDPAWARHLRLDIRTLFKRSLKYIHRNGILQVE
jgi:hypothetical protein